MAIIYGSRFNDDNTTMSGDFYKALFGTTENDEIYGFEGNDALIGGGGDDILDGGTGADYMWGGDQNDKYKVDNVKDQAIEFRDDSIGGYDTVFSDASSYTIGFGIEELRLDWQYFAKSFDGTGNEGNNLIIGNGNVNHLSGAGGDDKIYGFENNDELNGGNGNDQLYGGNGVDTLNGGSGADYLYGEDGLDTLDGGAGADTLDGGKGSDTYMVDDVGDVIIEVANKVGEIDRLYSSIDITALNDGIEELYLTGGAAIAFGNANNNYITGNNLQNNYLTGGDGDDKLFGGNGLDYFDGGTGADTMSGGSNHDTYVVDNINDVCLEDTISVSGGIDSVNASVSYALGNGIEDLFLTGTDNLNGQGNALDNMVYGNSGDNVLDGGLGADTLNGGYGNDTYRVDNINDVAFETYDNNLGGFDTVESTVSYTLQFGVEKLLLLGTDAIIGSGNSGNNQLTGNAANNELNGADGNDVLFGQAGNDILFGGKGDDTLDGEIGVDNMNGGDGDDNYYLDSVGDIVYETSATPQGGIDTVNVVFDYTLGYGFENLTLLGSNGINGTGNAQDNLIKGNLGANNLKGEDGNDLVFGDSGNDTVSGGAGNDQVLGWDGNDQLYGGDGVDTLDGGLGDDVLNDTDGTISGGDGIDTLQADYSNLSYNYSGQPGNESGIHLGYNGETTIRERSQGAVILTFDTVEKFNVTGTVYDDVLAGGSSDDIFNGKSGNDILIGGGGNDSLNGDAGIDDMSGGTGNDTYFVDDVGDKVTELNGGGTDTVNSSLSYTLGSFLEKLVLTGSAANNGTGNTLSNTINGNKGANLLSGLAGNDILNGNDGNDVLDGGIGNDKLTGGAGADQFLFNTTLGTNNVDTITDFRVNTDKIILGHSIFTHITDTGALSVNNFVANANGTAQEADDFLVYNTYTGALSYDVDGNGDVAAVQFVTLVGAPTLSAADIMIL